MADHFTGLQGSAGTMTLWMVIVVVLSFGICSLGVQRGLERITKSNDAVSAGIDRSFGSSFTDS